MSTSNIKKIVAGFSKLHVFVIGDVMLDNYWTGDVHRISPEAPVPILQVHKKEVRLGGAANVALNCKALGAEVSMLSVVGNDSDSKILLELLEKENIHSTHIVKSNDRKTTTKTRIMSKHQQMLRIDDESEEELQTKDEHHFIDICLRAIQIETPDIVIFEDYNKGVLKKNIIDKIIEHCKTVGVLTAVDPKKKNFLSYKGVDIFKPNLKEVKEALHTEIKTPTLAVLKKIHEQLQKQLQHNITLITLSEYGMFYQQHKDAKIVPAHIRNIADVSGAGDTVIAVASMAYAISKNMNLSTQLANLAGGLVCEEIGVVAINKQKLLIEYLNAE